MRVGLYHRGFCTNFIIVNQHKKLIELECRNQCRINQNQLHAESRTQQGRQREPSVKKLRFLPVRYDWPTVWCRVIIIFFFIKHIIICLLIAIIIIFYYSYRYKNIKTYKMLYLIKINIPQVCTSKVSITCRFELETVPSTANFERVDAVAGIKQKLANTFYFTSIIYTAYYYMLYVFFLTSRF